MARKDEKPGDQESSQQEQKSSPLKLIILVVLVLLLGGGGFFGYMKFFRAPSAPSATAHVEESVIQEMGNFLVNLADPGGKRYLKINIQMELTGNKALQEITRRNFEVRDSILMLLSSKEFDEVGTPIGKMNLKKELLSRLNKLLRDGQVKEIYFTEFLVQ
jgi:flagellar FliL protein